MLCALAMVGSSCTPLVDDSWASGGDATGSSAVPDTSVGGSGSGSTSGNPGTSGTSTLSGTSGASTSETTASTGSQTETSGASGESTATGNDEIEPVDCFGKIWACGNQEDDDGDGKVDLDDPECTGPCDNDEGSFATGLPSGSGGCRRDCYFDGNNGPGNDACIWDLRCDPESPGGTGNCAHSSEQDCDPFPLLQSQACIDSCTPLVPPGCDCFGCCTLTTDGAEINIYLDSGPDCALDNLAACRSCTPNESCRRQCRPEQCERCFGQQPEVLAPGCEPPPSCTGDLACNEIADCPVDWYCYLGCCYPAAVR